jgi:transcriptional regulator with XRE-family HTH domain
MPPRNPNGVGARIAVTRRARRLKQAELAALACVSPDTIKSIESGRREPGDDVLDCIAEALGTDPDRLRGSARHSESRVHAAIPALRAAVDAYDLPPDGPVRDLAALRRSGDALLPASVDRATCGLTCTRPRTPPHADRSPSPRQSAVGTGKLAWHLLGSAYGERDLAGVAAGGPGGSGRADQERSADSRREAHSGGPPRVGARLPDAVDVMGERVEALGC